MVRPGGAFQALALDGYPMPALATTSGQAGIAVKPIDTLVIGLNPFSANQRMQAAITESTTLSGQFDQSGFNCSFSGCAFA